MQLWIFNTMYKDQTKGGANVALEQNVIYYSFLNLPLNEFLYANVAYRSWLYPTIGFFTGPKVADVRPVIYCSSCFVHIRIHDLKKKNR